MHHSTPLLTFGGRSPAILAHGTLGFESTYYDLASLTLSPGKGVESDHALHEWNDGPQETVAEIRRCFNGIGLRRLC